MAVTLTLIQGVRVSGLLTGMIGYWFTTPLYAVKTQLQAPSTSLTYTSCSSACQS